MHKFNFHFILISLMIIGLFSCKKFLDEIPDRNKNVPQSLEDLQALLDNTSRLNEKTTPSFGESSAGDYFMTEADFNTRALEQQQIYTWQREDYFFGNDWSAGYLPVYHSNYCLERLKTVEKNPFNTKTWNNVYGSALFYRSYNFLNLLWNYALAYDEKTAATDKGIVLRESTDLNVRSVRSSVKDCYLKVINDTREALHYLPERSANVMRPSAAAAYGLLARSFLSMRIYDSAYKYADLCLSINDQLMDLNTDLFVNLSAGFTFRRFNREIIFFSEMTSYLDALYNPGYMSYIDTFLLRQYAENDLRKQAYFNRQSEFFKFKGSYSGRSQSFSGLSIDEIYLIRAESAARIDKKAEAMHDLNKLLRSRWNSAVPFVERLAITDKDALEQILIERRKELLMRGLRWIDIKRLNKEGRNIVLKRLVGDKVYKLDPNSPYYALPLPADVIRESGIEQN